MLGLIWVGLWGQGVACSGIVDVGSNAMVGEPCLPSSELDPHFGGFRIAEITLEHESADCRGGICLVNGFQGRVSCPRGQPPPQSCSGDGASCSDGQSCVSTEHAQFCPPQDGCLIPGSAVPVSQPVCGGCAPSSDHAARMAVHCTCRCGPASGQEPDPDADYCNCPSGFRCESLIPFIGQNDDTAGSYCVRADVGRDDTACGAVDGFWDPSCDGLPAG